jgi:signal transduction histidine kinase
MTLRSKIFLVSAPLCCVFAVLACWIVTTLFLNDVRSIEYHTLSEKIKTLEQLEKHSPELFVDLTPERLITLSSMSGLELVLSPKQEKLFRTGDPSSVDYGDTLSGQLNMAQATLGFSSNRDSFHLAQRQAWLISAGILLCAALAVGMIVVILEKLLLKRVLEINHGIELIRTHHDPYQRLEIKGHDEVVSIATHVNALLEDLHHHSDHLKQITQELERSNKELEQFAYVASHDLQEPLRKVQAFSDRLAKKYQQVLDDDGKLYIARMQDASQRMQVLIQDLLAYSRIRTKGQEFEIVDLNKIVQGVMSDLEVRLEQTQGKVEVSPLPTVNADPLQMRQVFQNLIGNALKFKKPDTPPIVKIYSEGQTIIIEDNGIGFEQHYAERIFEVFQRLHGRGEYEGTGIGLSIVRKILERHGGSITAQSRPGNGAKFTLFMGHSIFKDSDNNFTQPGIHLTQTRHKELV